MSSGSLDISTRNHCLPTFSIFSSASVLEIDFVLSVSFLSFFVSFKNKKTGIPLLRMQSINPLISRWVSGFLSTFTTILPRPEVWVALVLLGTWVGLEWFWFFLLDFVLGGRSVTWYWKERVCVCYHFFFSPVLVYVYIVHMQCV